MDPRDDIEGKSDTHANGPCTILSAPMTQHYIVVSQWTRCSLRAKHVTS